MVHSVVLEAKLFSDCFNYTIVLLIGVGYHSDK